MNAVAKQVVGSFDFDAARRFVESRSRQVRIELRVYAIGIVVLAVAGVVQHVLRRPDALWGLDRTDALFLLVLGMLVVAALLRGRVLASVGVGPSIVSGDALSPVADREAARVRRERVVGGAATVLATLGLAAAAVDSALDGAWLFALAFGVLAVLCSCAIRRYVGRRPVARAERYIAGQIDEVSYIRGSDGESER